MYDNAKRLKTVSRGGNTEATYDYNALGLRTKLTLGNDAYTENTYDGTTRWLIEMYNKTSTGTVISSFVYSHDKIGNRLSMSLAGGDVITYTYDTIYQVTSEQRTGTITYTNSWTYDNVGNRLTQDKWDGFVTTTTNYAYNNANQLISDTVNAVTTIYTYDANGNQTGKTIGANTWVWGFDYENRQTSYTDPITSTNNATYVYDALGRRIAKTVNGVTEKYILDGSNVIADYDGSDNLQATYLTPFLDENLLVITNSNTYYFMSDGLGSVRNLVDSVESVVNSYDYTAFGEALNWSENIPQRYTYTSREWDAESSTYHYRARQYNPTSGRFTARDPIEYYPGVNLYRYAKNNPARFIDPFGYITQQECEEAIREEINSKTTATQSWKLYQGILDKARLLPEKERGRCLDGLTDAVNTGLYNSQTSNIKCVDNNNHPCQPGSTHGHTDNQKGSVVISICLNNITRSKGGKPRVKEVLLHELVHASQVCCGNLTPITPKLPAESQREPWAPADCAKLVCLEIQAYCNVNYAGSANKRGDVLNHLLNYAPGVLSVCGTRSNIDMAFKDNYENCCKEPEGWRRPGETPELPKKCPDQK